MTSKLKAWDEIKAMDRKEKYASQEHFCNGLEIAIFITEDGICPYCDKNYLDVTTKGEAKITQITCCKLCRLSFVE